MKQIDKIRERLGNIEQWTRHDTRDYAEIHDTDTWGKALSPIALVRNSDDADFIARAPTDIAYLLTLVEEKDKQIEERDKRIAGMEDELRGLCWACIHSKPWDKAVFPNLTRTCEHLKERNIMAAGGRAGKDCPYWQWRGTQEEE